MWCDLPGAVPQDEIMAILGKHPKNNDVLAVSSEGSDVQIKLGYGYLLNIPIGTCKYLHDPDPSWVSAFLQVLDLQIWITCA
jgi:hypothetical protein